MGYGVLYSYSHAILNADLNRPRYLELNHADGSYRRHPVRPGDLCGIGIATIQAVMRQKLGRANK